MASVASALASTRSTQVMRSVCAHISPSRLSVAGNAPIHHTSVFLFIIVTLIYTSDRPPCPSPRGDVTSSRAIATGWKPVDKPAKGCADGEAAKRIGFLEGQDWRQLHQLIVDAGMLAIAADGSTEIR
jgi:hypothetical protein